MSVSVTTNSTSKSVNTSTTTSSVYAGGSSTIVTTTFVPPEYSQDAEDVFSRFVTDPPAYLKDALAVAIDAEVAAGRLNVTTPSSSLYNHILLLWANDENNALSDISGNNRDGTNVNAAAHTPVTASHSGFAGYLTNGSTNYINLGISPNDMDQDDVFTEVFVYENLDASNNANLFGTLDAGNANFYNILQQTNPRITGRVNVTVDGTNFVIGSSTLFQDKTWHGHHRANSTSMQIYRDGSQTGTRNEASTGKTLNNIYLGGANSAGSLILPLNAKITMVYSAKAVGFNRAAAIATWETCLTTLGILP